MFFEGNKGNKSNRGFDKLIQATTSLTEDFFKMWLLLLPLLPSIYIYCQTILPGVNIGNSVYYYY
jgi:hypothetical protein